MISVVVASKGRPKKLKNMVDSVPGDVPIYCYVTEFYDVEESSCDIFKIVFGSLTVIQANNLMIKEALSDYPRTSVVVACDDIEFAPGCFDTIREYLRISDRFVYGLTCTNMECNDDAFVCFGNKVLIENEGSPYCEEYKHFYADTEIGNKYKNLKRFKSIPAFFKNYHPNITGVVDKTHAIGRNEKLRHDKEVYENRHFLHR